MRSLFVSYGIFCGKNGIRLFCEYFSSWSRKQLWPISRQYPEIHLEQLRKPGDSLCLRQVRIWVPPKTIQHIRTEPTCSVILVIRDMVSAVD
jgi:hypothetical protein